MDHASPGGRNGRRPRSEPVRENRAARARRLRRSVAIGARSFAVAAGVGGAPMLVPAAASAQYAPHVLARSGDAGPDGPLPVDRGASGVWFRLKKLGTTASVLYTTAHPDDEQAGVLTLLSRGVGARTSLLTLNRGEGGANAIGPELFDALGLIRSEELRLAGRYYGLDDQYFTTVVDYGFSKSLEEAMRSWDREAVLDDMVRVIRTNRPLVVVSRFQGTDDDGHGHHQAAGVLTPEAVEAAADPARFPEQIAREGLRPWRVRRVYRPVRGTERPSHVRLEPGAYDPVLGTSYESFGNFGLSLQRSQTSGRMRAASGEPARFERVMPRTEERERGPFDGLDTTLPGVFDLTGERATAAAVAALREADLHLGRARAQFRMSDPSAIVPHLARALGEISEALGAIPPESDAAFLVHVERRETEAALLAAMGLEIEAIASRHGEVGGAPLSAAVPGDTLDVHVGVTSAYPARLRGLRVASRLDWPDAPMGAADWPIGPGESVREVVELVIPPQATPNRPWFHRSSVAHNRYSVRDSSDLHLGESGPVAWVATPIVVAGRLVQVETPLRVVESHAPFGTTHPPLTVAPPVSVRPRQRTLILPTGTRSLTVTVDVSSNTAIAGGALTVRAPPGWEVTPAELELSLAHPGEQATFAFEVETPQAPDAGRSRPAASPSAPPGPVELVVTATVGGRRYSEGYETIAHRDLGPTHLYRDATVQVVPIDVRTRGTPRVGYVMGVGDEVPAAIEQLGASVTPLDAEALASGDLSAFEVIVVGTRAYAVRPDLVASNRRLLDFARGGGHLVVLYQTPEYDPTTQAPFPASLPGNAEEVSEEDAPVVLLDPGHPLLTQPNRITGADFDGWIEQRGSKFFASWDPSYTALIETHDTGQAPQRGVWLTAEVGAGRFTYASIALHRQLPYGVPGAYRILANLISAGR